MKAVERPGIEPPPTGVRMKLARLRGSGLQRLVRRPSV
jgi:hypothetical protein